MRGTARHTRMRAGSCRDRMTHSADVGHAHLVVRVGLATCGMNNPVCIARTLSSLIICLRCLVSSRPAWLRLLHLLRLLRL